MSLFSIFGKKKTLEKNPANLHVTLWPSFDHFKRFATDPRIKGIRLNSAMITAAEIDDSFLTNIRPVKDKLWFDIKAMQMRVKEIVCGEDKDHLEFILNRPVSCKTPCEVYFKGGEDVAKLKEIRNGNHFIFYGGPKYIVNVGESIHIKDPDLKVGGEVMLPHELDKIDKIKRMGINNWYLSYVYDQKHVDAFREIIGHDDKLILKIENLDGLKYVKSKFKQTSNTNLMVARGDLFVELDLPHQILNASKLILSKDPDAFVGSRMMLSVIHSPIPSSSDICEVAWLYDVGFKNFLLCDELCLKEELLGRAVNVFGAFKKDYIEGKI